MGTGTDVAMESAAITLIRGDLDGIVKANRLSKAVMRNVRRSFTDDELVELALVLPRWQVEALAAAARGRGLTAGQALRRLIREFCADQLAPED